MQRQMLPSQKVTSSTLPRAGGPPVAVLQLCCSALVRFATCRWDGAKHSMSFSCLCWIGIQADV